MDLVFPKINYKYWLKDWKKTVGCQRVYSNKNTLKYISFKKDINSCTKEIFTIVKSNSLDFLSLASSFHWIDFDLGLAEFNRVLRKGGLFCAIWNTRQIKGNNILEDIENKIIELKPNLGTHL